MREQFPSAYWVYTVQLEIVNFWHVAVRTECRVTINNGSHPADKVNMEENKSMKCCGSLSSEPNLRALLLLFFVAVHMDPASPLTISSKF